MKHIYHILVISAMAFTLFACQGEEDALHDDMGYLRVALEQSADVNTKAYNPQQMHVVIKNSEGVVKFETHDHTADLVGKKISLPQGEYTIEAVSNDWDGSSGADCAYYAGKAPVTIEKGKVAMADVVCSLANVKVTVAFEQAFLDKLGNGSIKVQVKSATVSAGAIDFDPNTAKKVVYFPVSDLTVAYTVTSSTGKENSREQTISKVSAKDHYILNFKNTGTGNVTVTVDPTMNQYTYNFTVDPNVKNGATLSVSPWSRRVYLSASNITLDSGDLSSLKFQYRPKNTDTWMDVETTVDATAFSAMATLTGLTSATAYEYRLTDGEIDVAKGEFVTETEIALQNGGFEDWYKAGSIWYAATQSTYDAGTYLWDTSNPGGGSFGFNPTTGDDKVKHGGTYAAKLETQYAVVKLAAASLYYGRFVDLVGINGAQINFGQPFASRPIALKGWFQYKPEVIDDEKKEVGTSEVLKKGDTDICSIYIALAKKQYLIDNTNTSTFIDFNGDENIIAYGELPLEQCVSTDGQWKEFNIPLKYKTLMEQPTHIIVVCSSSKYGDYFTGGIGSTMYLDDFSLIYDGTPTLWE